MPSQRSSGRTHTTATAPHTAHRTTAPVRTAQPRTATQPVTAAPSTAAPSTITPARTAATTAPAATTGSQAAGTTQRTATHSWDGSSASAHAWTGTSDSATGQAHTSYGARPAGTQSAPQTAAPATAAPSAQSTAAPTTKATGDLDSWINQALAVMAANHIPGTYDGIYRNIMRESSGNPQAINLTDSNAAAGHPSKGLLQVIDPTFQAYHVPGTSTDIYDPVANIAAACNYAAHFYGSIDNVNGPY
ncbi:transglycosylase SLT domain-containing protein [Kitasatospora sp. DSM 101779]|uniref:transglycosylase SLT domain-containing protein n=1 Tax=Kitasatospora sp. DSM 101779 TaxID=2853165 RepID=UPI003985AC03